MGERWTTTARGRRQGCGVELARRRQIRIGQSRSAIAIEDASTKILRGPLESPSLRGSRACSWMLSPNISERLSRSIDSEDVPRPPQHCDDPSAIPSRPTALAVALSRLPSH